MPNQFFNNNIGAKNPQDRTLTSEVDQHRRKFQSILKRQDQLLYRKFQNIKLSI